MFWVVVLVWVRGGGLLKRPDGKWVVEDLVEVHLGTGVEKIQHGPGMVKLHLQQQAWAGRQVGPVLPGGEVEWQKGSWAGLEEVHLGTGVEKIQHGAGMVKLHLQQQSWAGHQVGPVQPGGELEWQKGCWAGLGEVHLGTGVEGILHGLDIVKGHLQ